MTRPFSIMRLDPSELAAEPAPPEWPAPDVDDIARQAPDASLVVRAGAALRARCSLWWTDAPPYEAHRVGAIGHFGAADAEAARLLLDAACDALAARGCTLAVGPMDGNTWRRYRLVTERGDEPPFFLEPTNPDAWPAWFEAAGFAPLAQYTSALATDLTRPDPRAEAAAERLTASGVTVRPVDLARFDDELRAIYSVAAVSFRANLLYTPIAEREFAAQYQAVRRLVRPELALLAEHEERAVGFAFSIPDALEVARGEPPRTVIVKTVAVLPERERYGGLGGWMVHRTHRTAAALGFTRAIHALMHETNAASQSVSARTGATMRRYTLFARALASARAGVPR
ncbi:hypothetical protein J421_1813 [Gemmatirosa kalamazoonensis]|uniref:GCN5-related N-acetyltransferase n=1 Tax=Gemmatirosa kalamazoonensis TaxID=861299 RepID=W0RG97_9BACT|nr:hypothetical protein [Gemmatirosa kalamazoonensis]AHG89350.1 hypothetical protein J421_1813 [Gemmatirosa kalamazoonensis]